MMSMVWAYVLASIAVSFSFRTHHHSVVRRHPWSGRSLLPLRGSAGGEYDDVQTETSLQPIASDINSYILSYNITIDPSNHRNNLYLPHNGSNNGSDIVSSITGAGSSPPSITGKRVFYIDPESPENLKKFTDDIDAIVARRRGSSTSSSVTDSPSPASSERIMNVRSDKKSWKSDHFHNTVRKTPTLTPAYDVSERSSGNRFKSGTESIVLDIDKVIVQDMSDSLVNLLKIEIINSHNRKKAKKDLSNLNNNGTNSESCRNRNRINGYVKELFGRKSHYMFKNDAQIESLVDLIIRYYIEQQNNYNVSEGMTNIIRAIKENNKLDIISNQIVNIFNLFERLNNKNDFITMEKIFLEVSSILLERFYSFTSDANGAVNATTSSRLDYYSYFLRPQNDLFLGVMEMGTVALIKSSGDSVSIIGHPAYTATAKHNVISKVVDLYIQSIFPMRKSFMAALFKAYVYIGNTGASLQLFERMISNNITVENNAILTIISTLSSGERHLERDSDQLELAYSLTKLLHKRKYFASVTLYASLFDRLICNSFSSEGDSSVGAAGEGKGRSTGGDVNDELKILLVVKDLIESNYNDLSLKEIANSVIGSIKRHAGGGNANANKNGLYRKILLLLLDRE